MVLAAFGCTWALAAPDGADDDGAETRREERREAREARRDARAEPVGGSLAGWGAVPVAAADEREDGLMNVWAQVQVWTTLWDQDVAPQADPATYGDPEADVGFSLRRARLGVDGYLPMGAFPGRSQVDYALAFGVAAPYDALTDGDGRTVELVDAFGRWALPTSFGVSSVAVGLQRVPFSRESMMSSADLAFEEVGVSTAYLAPNRELGAVGAQSVKLSKGRLAPQLLLRAGLFDGEGDLLGDAGPGMLGTVRLELAAGDAYRTYSADLDPAVGVGGAFLREGTPATERTSIEADLIGRYKYVTLFGELVTSTLTPTETDVAAPTVLDPIAELGWLGQLSVFAPIRADLHSGLDFAVRFASFDDDSAVKGPGDVSVLHGGVTWRNLLPRVDMGAGFIHRFEAADANNDTIRLWTQFRPTVRL